MVKNSSPHTIRNYCLDLELFQEFACEFLEKDRLQIKEIDKRLIRGYLAALNEEQKKRRTVLRRLSSLRSFFSHLIKEKIIKEFKIIDLAVYCSGYYEPHNTFDIKLDLFEKTFAVNFFGMINCFSILLPHFKSQKSGHLAAISSLAGFGGLPNSSSYGPSKAAMINYFESIKIDCDKNNISLSIINPGFVKSRLTEKNTFDMPFIMEADKAAEIIFEGLLSKKYDITFPIQMKIIFKILQILPRPIYFLLVKILTKNI